jgi:hypothetical protein
MPPSRLRALAARTLAVAGLASALVYAGDWLVATVRPQPFDRLLFYLATPLKNGRVEVYYDQPQTEICVRALFPHFGRRPCWYARRQRIHYAGAKIPLDPTASATGAVAPPAGAVANPRSRWRTGITRSANIRMFSWASSWGMPPYPNSTTR